MTTALKTCFKCEAERPLTDFYKHPQMGDGHLNKCKECTKTDAKNTRRKRIDYYRAYDRKRGNRQTAEYRKRYREQNPVKTGARTLVGNAVRDGRLVKPRCCEDCGKSGRLHGHHDDYARPMEVRWLCPACHHQWHAVHGEAKNG